MDAAGSGKAFPALSTVFVTDAAPMQTWYHELGHVLYWSIKNSTSLLETFGRVRAAALGQYPVVTHDEMPAVLHPKTREEVKPAPGRYVAINGLYCGLDHSGDGEDGEADELWAILFAEHQMGHDLTPKVRTLVEATIVGLQRERHSQKDGVPG